MGGWGSGRHGGRPICEHAKAIDLAWMLRTGRLWADGRGSGTLAWTVGGESAGSISYRFDTTDPDRATITLDWRTLRAGENWRDVRQTIHLVQTQPHFGGKRWWMLCPIRGDRVGKLYLPAGGDVFAGRKAWGLGYQSQRVAVHDRPFERLFALQRRLGCTPGFEQPIRRPKGMWRSTFDRLEQRYWELDGECALQLAHMMGVLRGSLSR